MENGALSTRIVTLTTDFGHLDSYVGQMKGAMLSVDSQLRIVDLCHGVRATSVAQGAYLLETGYSVFPAGTVHVAVVDPGVGTERRPLAVRAGSWFFVAPDNGLLTRVLLREPLHEARIIEEEAFLRPVRSSTFEGRDLFAPAAASIAGGAELARIGPLASELVRLPEVRPAIGLGAPVEVPVLHVDRFGNVVLDVHVDSLTALVGEAPYRTSALRLRTPAGEIDRCLRTFADAVGDEPFLLVNSAGYLEVAVQRGRADLVTGLVPGARPVLTVGG
jgi:S-adenosylmethionine hydrolase